MARFEREARLPASLNHPHIAAICGVGAEEGVHFLAMELIEGADLAVRIAQGPVPVVEAVEYTDGQVWAPVKTYKALSGEWRSVFGGD